MFFGAEHCKHRNNTRCQLISDLVPHGVNIFCKFGENLFRALDSDGIHKLYSGCSLENAGDRVFLSNHLIYTCLVI